MTMSWIDLPVVARIVSMADVPIDTYLAFRDIGVKPKKLAPQLSLVHALNAMHNHRYMCWREHNAFKYPMYCALGCVRTTVQVACSLAVTDDCIHLRLFSRTVYIQIDDFDKTGDVRMAFKVRDDDEWTIRRSHHVMHTGEVCPE